MKVHFVGYIAALVALAILDALWLGAMSRDFYKARLGQLLLEQPNWYAAILLAWGAAMTSSRHRGGFPGDARRLKDQCSSLYSG